MFIIVLITYCVYWCGVDHLAEILGSKWVALVMIILNVLMMLYTGIIQQVIGCSYSCDKRDKNEKAIEKNIIRQALKDKKNGE